MTTREELHWLVEYIPDSDVPTPQKSLRALVGLVETAILPAPEDDEPESIEERAAVWKQLWPTR